MTFAVLAAVIQVLGLLFPEDPDDIRYFNPAPSIFAAIFLGLAIWLWLFLNVPLIVASDGRVTYGSRELCPAGSVECVKIEEQPTGDGPYFQLSLQLLGGKVVALPAPYFDGKSCREEALNIAQAVANELRVQLKGPS